jgi:hypothetical protein
LPPQLKRSIGVWPAEEGGWALPGTPLLLPPAAAAAAAAAAVEGVPADELTAGRLRAACSTAGHTDRHEAQLLAAEVCAASQEAE